jgi:hypothetical protein
MIRRAAGFFALAILATACTEHLTQPGECPTFCPGGAAVFRDTVLTATFGADSSFSGYLADAELTSVLVSSGGSYGQTRGILRFLPRGDSVLAPDTLRSFVVDSAFIEFFLQAYDTTQSNTVIDLYKLPPSVDSTTTQAQLDLLMTPGTLIAEVPVRVALPLGVYHVALAGDDLAKIAFTPEDSTRLMVGFRIRADGPTAGRIGAPASGGAGPLFVTYVTADVADTAARSQIISRPGERALTARVPGETVDNSLLVVGGYPVSRTFLRFTVPEYLRDSVTIIRATLELTGAEPVFGIPADTAQLVASAVLTDFGAKSPISTTRFGFTPMISGSQSMSMEVGPIVRAWQGTTPLPAIIRLALGSEGATFIAPRFNSSRSATGMPRLRITYRPPYSFVGL